MFAVQQVFPLFFDLTGYGLNAGSVYIGAPNLNPETNPIVVYWDALGTQPVAQPVKTLNGTLCRDGTPANVYISQDYSITVRDKLGRLVYTQPNSNSILPTISSSLTFDTQASVIAGIIDDSVDFVSVVGFTAIGDGGEAMYKSVPDVGALLTHQFRSNGGTRRWQLIPQYGFIKPQQIIAVGAADDRAAIVAADISAKLLGVELLINRQYNIASSLTFTAPVKYVTGGKLILSASALVTHGAGFDAALHAQIFDMSAAGAGFARARVTARELTPQMFGAVGNSPSTDDAPALMRMWKAASNSGLPMNLTPNKFTAKQQIEFDYGVGSEYTGLRLFGQGTQSEIAFANDVASPNLKISDLTGTLISPANQYATFYGEHEQFQVSGAIAGGVVLQYGENVTLGGGGTSVYFNGLKIRNVVVKNNKINAGGISALLSGMTDCDIDMTCNAGGAFNDGSIAMQLMHSAFNRFGGSCGNAEVGIYLSAGSIFSNQWDAFDLEVLKTGFKSRSINAVNNVYHGVFASMDYAVDCQQNSGAMMFNNCQFGGIAQGYIKNYDATDATYGGYGVTFYAPQNTIVGYRKPGATYDVLFHPLSGTWYRNTYGQNALVTLYTTSTITALDIRQWFDTTSTDGSHRIITSGTNVTFLLKAGESYRVTGPSGATSISATWKPAE